MTITAERVGELIDEAEAHLRGADVAEAIAFWADTITVLEVGKTLLQDYFHLNSGGLDPNERRYTKRDVDALVSIALAVQKRRASIDRGGSSTPVSA